MFDLAELYTEWTEDPQSFWGETEIPPAQLQLQLTVEMESILDENIWSQVVRAACPPAGESPTESREWLGIIISGLKAWSQAQPDAATDSQDSRREALEKYLFLTRMHLARLDKELDTVATTTTSRRSNAAIVRAMDMVSSQLVSLLDAVSRTLMGGLEMLFPSTAAAKRASLALLYLEPSCRLLQREIVVKDSELELQIVRVLSLGVKLQQQQAMMRTQLLQLLTYYEHTTDVVVQLLETLRNQFDHTALAQAVLRDLVEEAMSWRDTASPAVVTRAKCVSAFLQRLVHVIPTLVARELPIITPLFWSPAPQLRQAAMDVSAVIIPVLLESEREDEEDRITGAGANDSVSSVSEPGDYGSRYKPAADLIEILEQRVNDVSHFCRLHALQTLTSVAKLRALASHRERFTHIACEKMKDRTQLVRRQAMRFMKELLLTHPNVIPANQLSITLWRKSLTEVEERLDQDETEEVAQQLEAAQALCKLTIAFIEQVDASLKIAQTLLMSKSKSDILDAVELLVYADAHGVESSASGIRSIVHLVWAKADNDEGNAVCKTAVATYRDLFLTAPPELTPRQKNHLIADNLISLAKDASPGELTSLERLLCLALDENMVDVGTVGRLWGLYQSQNITDPARRRGAAIVLGMLALADKGIARSGIGALVNIGLNPEVGLHDLELAKYSCVILKRSSQSTDEQRLPANYELFDRIIDFMLYPAPEAHALEWCSFAKEALMGISSTCEAPPKVFTRLIQEYLVRVFGERSGDYSESKRQALFAQLIYVVGEVALNLLVYLERSELDFKRRRQELEEQQRQTVAVDGEDEEEMMAGGGSIEDTFVDALHEVREVELMYSDRSLLKPFAGMIVELCESELQRSRAEKDTGEPAGLLVIAATQSLSKFMCVSSHFCSDNLPLLVELMSEHESNVVRSNFMVALGDVAICFNRLIDDHTEFLYDRLNDRDQVVQRTCIVSLTFLILAGQIKVKGKLGEMAKAVAHPNRKISTLATMFFRELSAKENAIYNSFLDMLSSLIADETLAEKDLLSVLKFLAQLVEKERQMKQLTDKLVQRLPRCETQRQWAGIVQVLKHLPRKMEDNVKELIATGFTPLGSARSEPSSEDEGGHASDEEDNAPGGSSLDHAAPPPSSDHAEPGDLSEGAPAEERARRRTHAISDESGTSSDAGAADLSIAVGDMSLVSA